MTESSPEKNADRSRPAAATSIMDKYPHKVFVGNLAFKTTDESLKEFFQAAGKVEVANVIKRGKRSLGYGFVALDSSEAVDKAVAELDKLDLDGRPVNVEAAKPKEELVAEHMEHAPKPRRGEGGRRPASRRRMSDEGEEGMAAPGQEAADDKEEKLASGQEAGQPARRGRNRGHFREAPRRPPRGPRGPPRGEPSKSTVFVSNLPYSVDDAELHEIFKDYEILSATVVKRFGGTRSKGFGFVEFASEEQQKLVLSKAEDFESEGRHLLIKVATSDQRPPSKETARVDDDTPDAGAQTV